MPGRKRTAHTYAAGVVAGGSAWSALWTFPSMIGAAFLVAWGAEAAEFLISQGLALAVWR